MPEVTMYMDGGIPIKVDEEEFEIIKLMVEEAGANEDLRKIHLVIKNLEKQGYKRSRARLLCILARQQVINTNVPMVLFGARR